MDKATIYNRRQLMRISGIAAVAAVLSNCSGLTAPAPAATPAPAGNTVGDYIKGIADAVISDAAQWGVSQTTLATLNSAAQTLEGIATKVSGALAVGGSIASYANDALPYIETIVSFIPGGSALSGVLTAIQTLTPLIAAAAGKQMATRPTGMSPDMALATLRQRAARQPS